MASLGTVTGSKTLLANPKREIDVEEENRNWEEIVHQLKIEKDPQKKKQLQCDLGAALEDAGFKLFSKRRTSLDEEE